MILLTGTKGMYKAIDKKLQEAEIFLSYQHNTRPMHDWEAMAIEIHEGNQDPQQIRDIIGKRLITKYMIHFD